MEFQAFFPFNEIIEDYSLKVLLNYRTIPHAGRKQSPSGLRGKQIRALINMSYSTKENVWYRKDNESNLEKAKFLLLKGHNSDIREK